MGPGVFLGIRQVVPVLRLGYEPPHQSGKVLGEAPVGIAQVDRGAGVVRKQEAPCRP